MAFKNEDLAIHIDELFSQDIWTANLNELVLERLYLNERVKAYAASPKGVARRKEYRAQPEIRERLAAQARARYVPAPPKPAPTEAELQERAERRAKQKQAWKEANREAVRAQSREYMARRRAEKMKSVSQPDGSSHPLCG